MFHLKKSAFSTFQIVDIKYSRKNIISQDIKDISAGEKTKWAEYITPLLSQL